MVGDRGGDGGGGEAEMRSDECDDKSSMEFRILIPEMKGPARPLRVVTLQKLYIFASLNNLVPTTAQLLLIHFTIALLNSNVSGGAMENILFVTPHTHIFFLLLIITEYD